jgi:hypothetical protein
MNEPMGEFRVIWWCWQQHWLVTVGEYGYTPVKSFPADYRHYSRYQDPTSKKAFLEMYRPKAKVVPIRLAA